ncbi:MAG: nitrate- and nitrite sensing domain-containing protein [Actinocatenispora sp.]
MSNRTSARGDSPQRTGGLVPHLRNVRIRSKLALLLLVPVLALVTLGATRLAGNASTFSSASDLRSLVQTGAAAANLADSLQVERSAAVSLLGRFSDDKGGFQRKITLTDEAYQTLVKRRQTMSAMPDALAGPLDRVESELRTLDQLRTSVTLHRDVTTSDTSFRYRTIIGNLLDYRTGVAGYTSDADIGGRIRAANALVQAKEYVAEEQVDVLRSLSTGQFAPAQVNSFAATVTGYTTSLLTFTETAKPTLTSQYERALTGAAVSDASAMETVVNQTIADRRLNVDGVAWNTAMDGRLRLMQSVDKDAETDVISAVSGYRDTLSQQLILESSAIFAAMLLAILFALLIARSMSGGLRTLRESALRVAYEDLPAAVADMQRNSAIGSFTPDQLVSQVVSPIQVRGRDELGQVSEAFNVVHREAVRVAAEQAVLRASVSKMFVNLARRSQLLVDRLIGHLDRLEQGEEDPDRLAQLFQLDHLATRMRRNDENLLVLAGVDSTRARREAAPLGDVLRAAQSEVEQYTRIEFGVVDRDVNVKANAVNDVAHLVAELVDNATSFSSPDTAVVVDARRVGDRAIVQIEDRGIGMSSDMLAVLNDQLVNPPLVDVAVPRMMGLIVVGRLATRLGITVELRLARDRGIVADVTLPSSVLLTGARLSHEPEALPAPPSSRYASLESAPSADRQPALTPSSDRYSPSPSPDRYAALNESAPSSDRYAALTEPAPSSDRYAALNESAPSSDRYAALAEPAPSSDRYAALSDPAPAPDRYGAPFDPPPADRYAPPAETRPTPARYGSAFEPASSSDRHSVPGEPAPDAPRRGIFDPAPRAATPDPSPSPSPSPEPTPVTRRSLWTSELGNDVTAETPVVRDSGRPEHNGAGPARDAGRSEHDGAGRPATVPPMNIDETTELPIFRESESAWFRIVPTRPRDLTADDAAPGPASGRPSGQPEISRPLRSAEAVSARRAERRAPAPAPTRTSVDQSRPVQPPPPTREPVPETDLWHSAADEGWQTAAAVAETGAPDSTTGTGLPRRQPMAQLVPGAIEEPGRSTPVRERSPEAIRGLLSAYHRGVQRGRAGGEQPRTMAGHGTTNGEERV